MMGYDYSNMMNSGFDAGFGVLSLLLWLVVLVDLVLLGVFLWGQIKRQAK